MTETPALSAKLAPALSSRAPGKKSLVRVRAAVPAPIRDRLDRERLVRLFSAWRRDCQIAQHSERSLDSTQRTFAKLLWFLDLNDMRGCGAEEVRDFFAYIAAGRQDAPNAFGRWGVTVAARPAVGRLLKPLTVKTYFGHLRAFFNWVVAQHELDASPMSGIKMPISRADQIQPFTDEQVDALLAAARRSPHPKRDCAIILLLLDTGLRVSEMCSLKMSDLDTTMKTLRVEGKGGKERTVYFGRATSKALWAYRQEPRKLAAPGFAPLFAADRGECAGGGLTASGIRQLLERLAIDASVTGVRVSPHTFRHTFAVSFLRGGGNCFSLQQLMGHATITQTMKYVKFVEGDLEKQHRLYSPVDRLSKKP